MAFGTNNISLSDLATAGVRLRPSEAVSIVCHLARQVSSGQLPGVPSAHVIRFAGDGEIVLEGPIAAGGPEVARTAHLLESLMSAPEAGADSRVPGALRLIVARALGAIDLPPYRSLDAFIEALERFAERDVRGVVRELFVTWTAAVEASRAGRGARIAQTASGEKEPLTISDIRRARRSTRLTLGEVSQRSHIPAWLLRELEWGYFRNWPAGLYGRTQLVRYARAAGLDEHLVVQTIWPLLEEAARARGTAAVSPADLVPADPQDAIATTAMLVPAPRGPLLAMSGAVVRRTWKCAALIVAVLLLVALLPAIVMRWTRSDQATARPAAARTERATPDAPARTNTAAADSQLAIATDESDPDAEPVGTAMFYGSGEEDPGAPVRAGAAGATLLRITRIVDDGARYANARLSPDRSRIAFDSDRDGRRAVYVADADGRNIRKVSGEGVAAMPAWSPDGQTIAYVGAGPQKDAGNLWIVDLHDGRARQITSHTSGSPAGASWFPDGRRLAYAFGTKLIVLDLEARRSREFRSPISGRAVRMPAVRPDGRQIIFQVEDDGAWLLDLERGFTRRVLDDPSTEEYTWAPDGGRVAYHSRRNNHWGILVVSPHN